MARELFSRSLSVAWKHAAHCTTIEAVERTLSSRTRWVGHASRRLRITVFDRASHAASPGIHAFEPSGSKARPLRVHPLVCTGSRRFRRRSRIVNIRFRRKRRSNPPRSCVLRTYFRSPAHAEADFFARFRRSTWCRVLYYLTKRAPNKGEGDVRVDGRLASALEDGKVNAFRHQACAIPSASCCEKRSTRT